MKSLRIRDGSYEKLSLLMKVFDLGTFPEVVERVVNDVFAQQHEKIQEYLEKQKQLLEEP